MLTLRIFSGSLLLLSHTFSASLPSSQSTISREQAVALYQTSTKRYHCTLFIQLSTIPFSSQPKALSEESKEAFKKVITPSLEALAYFTDAEEREENNRICAELTFYLAQSYKHLGLSGEKNEMTQASLILLAMANHYYITALRRYKAIPELGVTDRFNYQTALQGYWHCIAKMGKEPEEEFKEEVEKVKGYVKHFEEGDTLKGVSTLLDTVHRDHAAQGGDKPGCLLM